MTKPPDEILTRAEAVALGRKFYFSGVPCRNGHTARRYTTAGSCTECLKTRNVVTRRALNGVQAARSAGFATAVFKAPRELMETIRAVIVATGGEIIEPVAKQPPAGLNPGVGFEMPEWLVLARKDQAEAEARRRERLIAQGLDPDNMARPGETIEQPNGDH